MPEHWIVVDGDNIAQRSIHAMKGHELSAHGVNTGPAMNFIRAFAKYVRDLPVADRMVVCFDAGHVHRDEIFAGYKANRHHHEDERDARDSTYALICEFLAHVGITIARRQGYEADDLVAAYASRIDTGDRVTILSGDKDLLQLVRDADITVTVLRPGDPIEWDFDRVEAEYGCAPEVLPYLFALVGDVSDNIPGIRGIGPKTAMKILYDCEYDWRRVLQHDRVHDHVGLVQRNLALVDLSLSKLVVPVPARFAPPKGRETLMGQEFVRWLERYELAGVLDSYDSDTLWTNPGAELNFFGAAR